MSVADSRKAGKPLRRAELRFNNFVMGDGRPSTYRYVFVSMDESGDMQERDGAFRRPALGDVSFRKEGMTVQRHRVDVAATRHAWIMRNMYYTAGFRPVPFAGAEGGDAEEAEDVRRPMLNACLRLATPLSATEVAGGRLARDLDAILRKYVRSGSVAVSWVSVLGSMESVHGRDSTEVFEAFWPRFSQFVERDREASAEVETGVVSPSALADLVVRTHGDSDHWLDSFAERLFKLLPGAGLKRVMRVWNLEGQEAADGFGVSEETLAVWLRQGVPADAAEPLAHLSAATDLLLRHLKADRIPAVVRRPAGRLGGKSLVDLYSERNASGILEACRDMFRFEDVHA